MCFNRFVQFVYVWIRGDLLAKQLSELSPAAGRPATDATADATIENDKPAEAETDDAATKVRLRGRRRESRRDF